MSKKILQVFNVIALFSIPLLLVSCITAIETPLDAPEVPTIEQSTQVNESPQQIVEEFLSIYHSLFSFGFVSPDGTYWDLAQNELSGRPLVVWEIAHEYPWNVYYDRLGNRIEDAPFLRDGGFLTDFTLYDLNDGGMPTIVMRWGVPETCISLREVWRFVDGKYRNAGSLMGLYHLFHDPEGNLIVYYNDVMNDIMAYYFLTFTNNAVEHEPIDDVDNRDIVLIPVQRLTELENEIIEAVRFRNGV